VTACARAAFDGVHTTTELFHISSSSSVSSSDEQHGARGGGLKAKGMAITGTAAEPKQLSSSALHQVAALTAVQSFPGGRITSAASTDSPCSYDVQESAREDAIVSRFLHTATPSCCQMLPAYAIANR
jgi:hypothetical protein